MFKFFRKIRIRLLTESSFGKYLVYAIGEIILVVIGIFIAIQLNAWNEERIAKRELNGILENLEGEFERTRTLLANIASEYDNSIRANMQLLEWMEGDNPEIAPQSLDTLLANCANQAPFFPVQTLDEPMQGR